MKMNKKLVAIASAALVLTAVVSVAPTMSYFTATSTASGTAAIALTDTTTNITESGSNQTKVITVNNEKNVPCYTRVMVVMPAGVTATFTGTDWSLGSDGYYYYAPVVAANGKTTDLTLNITIDEKTMTSKQFNVVVIPESVKVLYNADGTAYADWTQQIDGASTKTYEEAAE